jgi:hypothetical protein
MRHKEETKCDGIRDRVKYVHLTKFTDMDIVNDFRLLEEVTHAVDKCKRDKIKRSTRQGDQNFIAPKLNRHLQTLQNRAKERGIQLKILPPHFVRRKNNSSRFDYKGQFIKWHIQLQFPNANKSVYLEAVNERIKLWRLLADYLEFKIENDPSDPFQQYRSVSYGGISLFLKAEGMPKQGEKARRFHELDMKRSLKSNLENKVLVEHPIIIVAFKTDDHMYREEQDCFVMETSDKSETHMVKEGAHAQEGTKPDDVSVADVLSQAEAMQADPDTYKHYFDFYLKYYSAKYSQQPPKSEDLSSPFTCPPPSLDPSGTLYPTLVKNLSNNTFPNRSSATLNPPTQNQAFGNALLPNTFSQPPPNNFSQPPPNTFSQPPPNTFAAPPPDIAENYTRPSINFRRGNKSQKENNHGLLNSPQTIHVAASADPLFNKESVSRLNSLQEKQFLSSFPSKKSHARLDQLNASNVASAKLIQAELKNHTNSDEKTIENGPKSTLSGLVAYEDSDSD